MTIAWIDLETTGLNPKTDAIVEAACVVTDDDLREIARFERVIFNHYAAACSRILPEEIDGFAAASGIDRVVIEMHRANGLWAASAASENSSGSIEAELADFLREHVGAAPAGHRPQLGGSSVHFDRSFLVEDMPKVAALLHHRHLDTSTLNELARRTWSEVYAARPGVSSGAAHRAMPDVLASIETARYYRRALMPAHATDPTAITQQIARWLHERPAGSVDDVISGILRGDWRPVLPASVPA